MVLPQQLEGPAPPRMIEEGDLVIVYESFAAIKSAYVDAKATYTSRFGTFPHKNWLGMRYGTKAYSRPPGRGWVQLLLPTPELWTLVLRHRTQILYLADISLVVSQLDLRPGSVVLESGTGSASLTHSLARAVAPSGCVRSFEFHELRAREAGAELARNGVPQALASVTLRNIEERGFPVDELAGTADGVFLDLPGPWRVVPSAAACLKPDGRFCSFSPCIEQVQRTCEALDANGMTDIITYEVLLRNYEVAEDTLLVPLDEGNGTGTGNGGCGKFGACNGGEGGPAATAIEGAEPAASRKRGLDEESGSEQQQQQQQQQDADLAPQQEQQQEGQDQGQEQQQRPAGALEGGRRRGPLPLTATRPLRMAVAKPSMDARGHTGYLTFARKFV